MEDFYVGGAGKGQEKRGLSVEQKLELSHMLRQEQDYNRMQMDKREMLVYGKAAFGGRKKRYGDAMQSGYGRTSMLQAAEDEEAKAEAAWQKMQWKNRVSLVTRGFLAVLLFVIVLLMRFSGLEIYNVDYRNLMDSLQSEEFINGIHLEELMPDMENEQEPQKGEASAGSVRGQQWTVWLWKMRY